ncbi:MAG: sulfur carrier protein ThiS adenylyltransferase ThiF [Desulfovibrionaceae bacterium]|nr:sulfur carrier protein ThiS adenylyltransferase ThiF [Desulfovibrionaceae bacterium]
MSNILEEGLQKIIAESDLKKLQNVRIGIAGLGGLGSNCAMLLARSGVRNFVLIDYDKVEASNLNRQQYMPYDVGLPKTQALSQRLMSLNPKLNLTLLNTRLTEENCQAIVQKAPYWLEAFDAPQAKALLVENALLAKAFVVAASGVGGFGPPPLQTKSFNNLVVVGTFVEDSARQIMWAPKVTWAASMMCDILLNQILKNT